jgi:hypothetical protein
MKKIEFYLSFHSIFLTYVVLWLYYVMNQLLHNVNSQFQRWDKLMYETKVWRWVISTKQYHKLIGFNSWSKVIDPKCVRSSFTIVYFTPIWKPRQISLAKICTILFSIPRNALWFQAQTQKQMCTCVGHKKWQCGKLQLPIMPTVAPLLSDQRESLQMSTPGHIFHHSLQKSPEPMCGEGTC